MTQQPACVPPEGAEDGSWHWLQEAQEQPKAFRWRKGVKRWFWQFGAYDIGAPEPSEENGWRYIGPASPADATDLTAARAENAKLAAEVKDAWDTIRDLETTHAAQIASANVLIARQRARLSVLEGLLHEVDRDEFISEDLLHRVSAALGQSATPITIGDAGTERGE